MFYTSAISGLCILIEISWHILSLTFFWSVSSKNFFNVGTDLLFQHEALYNTFKNTTLVTWNNPEYMSLR